MLGWRHALASNGLYPNTVLIGMPAVPPVDVGPCVDTRLMAALTGPAFSGPLSSLTPPPPHHYTTTMHEQNKAILQALVPVAWADGAYAKEEQDVIEALLAAFEATPEEAEELRTYASTPKGVDDIPITELSFDDRRILLQHAVFLSHADGEPKESERTLIDAMVEKLRIPAHEAAALRDVARERAQRWVAAR